MNVNKFDFVNLVIKLDNMKKNQFYFVNECPGEIGDSMSCAAFDTFHEINELGLNLSLIGTSGAKYQGVIYRVYTICPEERIIGIERHRQNVSYPVRCENVEIV